MINQKEINRLGFDAWASNIVVNAIEDYEPIITSSNSGTVTNERKEYTMSIIWDEENVSITVRAYTIDNWQSLESNIKRSSIVRKKHTVEHAWPSAAPRRIAIKDTGIYNEV
jgi:oligoribonuclease NrnB/cAMP/cGMP phosphodiesterase (DHH superfamily)